MGRWVQVRKRAADLQQQLGQLRLQLTGNAAAVSWDALLIQFSIISGKLVQLKAELRPQLQHYVAHPQELTEANISRARTRHPNAL